MNIAKLRERLPVWAWRPVRARFGWDYEGTLGGVRVEVYPASMLCGGDDDFRTEWFVRLPNGNTDRFDIWASYASAGVGQ